MLGGSREASSVPLRLARGDLVAETDGLPRLAEQLTWLIDNIPDRHGKRFTTESLRAEIGRHGQSISAVYLGYLRQGRSSNISAVLLGALAKSFGVPADFFLDEEVERRVREAVDTLVEARREAMKASGADRITLEEGIRSLREIVNRRPD